MRQSYLWPSWRRRVAQLALLCFIALHSVGLLHNHVTQAEHDACFACQVVDHQSFDVSDSGSSVPFLLLLLYLALPRAPRVAPARERFDRPRSRAPPSCRPV